MIKLVKPGWKAGKEKRFMDFVKNVGAGKLILLSHVGDLDGVASAKVVNDVIKPGAIRFIDYYELGLELVQELKREGWTKIILTDLYIKNKEFVNELEKFADVLIIDHHPVQTDYNSSKTVFMNAKGYAAAYLTYYLFSKIKNVEKYDWLVACAAVSDFMRMRAKKWISDVYAKYGDKYISSGKGVNEYGVMWGLIDDMSLSIAYFKPKTDRVFSSIGSNFGDIGDLKKYSDAVRSEIGVIERKFEKEKVQFRGGYFFQFECIFPVKSFFITKISMKMKNQTIIVIEKKGENISLSARRQDDKVDLNKFLPKMISGFENSSAGGHKVAAGGNFPSKYLDEFKNRLKNLK